MKLLHAADFHLDAPFAALSPEKAALRRREGRALLGRLSELARSEGVDLVLLAGDLFDGERVYRETLDALRDALGRIPAPVLIAPGNHDPYIPRSPYATLDWPDNVTIFSSEAVTSIPFPEKGCVVHGLGFQHGSLHDSLLEGFRAPADGALHIGLCHGEVTQGPSAYHPITPAAIGESALTYLALGHVHAPSGLQKSGDTFWAYPGCPEGHGFDELGDRGCLLVEADHDGVSARFVPLAGRRYLEMDVDVTGTDPLRVAAAALDTLSPEDCVKLRLVGETETPCDLDRLSQALSDRVFALRLRDRTRPRAGLWDKAGEDTLTGVFLRLMKERLDTGEPDGELALRFGLAALNRGEDPRP